MSGHLIAEPTESPAARMTDDGEFGRFAANHPRRQTYSRATTVS